MEVAASMKYAFEARLKGYELVKTVGRDVGIFQDRVHKDLQDADDNLPCPETCPAHVADVVQAPAQEVKV